MANNLTVAKDATIRIFIWPKFKSLGRSVWERLASKTASESRYGSVEPILETSGQEYVMPTLTLKHLAGQYAITQLPSGEPVPTWHAGEGITSASRGSTDLTLVCRQDRVPADISSDQEWACFEVVGPVALGEAGIALSLLRPLSENDIGIFLIPTFASDYLLMKVSDVERGQRYLMAAGHTIL